MVSEQLTSLGGLMQESMISPIHGFNALGSDSIETLPTPDPDVNHYSDAAGDIYINAAYNAYAQP
jgi:hypothetical protein|tara:strand:- start:882 stop:1076 length:195 start_codon:yes stop_codon:yes gene_type:complete